MVSTSPSFLLLGSGGYASLGTRARTAGLKALARRAFGAETRVTASVAMLGLGLPHAEELPLRYWQLFALSREIASHDVLVIGADDSGYGADNAVQLNWAFVALRIARLLGRRTLLVAPPSLPSGERALKKLTRMAQLAGLVIAPSEEAAQALRSVGIRRHMEVLCDPLFALPDNMALEQVAADGASDRDRPLLGLAPVDIHAYPLGPRIRAHSALSAGWPAYSSWGPSRHSNTVELEQAWTNIAVHAVKARGYTVKLIPSCELSMQTCQRILARLTPECRYYIKLAGDGTDPYQVMAQLPSLDHLLTSSYSVAALGLFSSVATGVLAGDSALNAFSNGVGLPDSLLETHERLATELQLERLFNVLTFSDNAHLSRQTECLFNELLPACDQFVTVLQEWWTAPEYFLK